MTEIELERLKQRLLKLIDADEDSLRFYRLTGPRAQSVEAFVRDGYRAVSTSYTKVEAERRKAV